MNKKRINNKKKYGVYIIKQKNNQKKIQMPLIEIKLIYLNHILKKRKERKRMSINYSQTKIFFKNKRYITIGH